MKYSIFQYSQEKLLEYSLDVIDALILSWFSDFFVGSMEKKIFKDEASQTSKLYGWVKLSKVMEDLPCIGINSEKGIKRRFDGFVEKGIMERKSVITQNGKKTFYRPTELYESLINTKKIHQKETEEKEVSHDHENIHAEEKGSHRIKTTDAEFKKSADTPHDYENILAEGNENILAHDHENIHALNDSSISDDAITDAAIIKRESDKIFGENYFDSNFPQKAADFFHSKDIKSKDIHAYFKFILDKIAQKGAKNPRGLAYSLLFQDDIFQEFEAQKEQQQFLEQKQKEEKRKKELRMKTCPACGYRLDSAYLESCPECYFHVDDFHDAEKIEKQKKFNNLSPEQQKNYNSEYLAFKNELPLFEKLRFCATEEGKRQQAEYILRLDKKYGLVR